MTPLLLLLRDAALLAVATTAGVIVVDRGLVVAFAVGALAGLFNLGLWVVAARGLLFGGFGQSLLPVKLFAAIGIVWALTHHFPGSAALFGFALPFAAILGRALVSLPSFVRAR